MDGNKPDVSSADRRNGARRGLELETQAIDTTVVLVPFHSCYPRCYPLASPLEEHSILPQRFVPYCARSESKPVQNFYETFAKKSIRSLYIDRHCRHRIPWFGIGRTPPRFDRCVDI